MGPRPAAAIIEELETLLERVHSHLDAERELHRTLELELERVKEDLEDTRAELARCQQALRSALIRPSWEVRR
jgi:chromosome segregation ATPase